MNPGNFGGNDLPAKMNANLGTLNSIMIGIDFGTTYSGIAWSHTATAEKINVIDKWQSGRRRTSEKVPTEIAYTDKGLKWGFAIPPDVERLAWFKLLLDPSKYSLSKSKNNSPLARTRKLIPYGKEPVDVVADFLSQLNKHTMDHLERTLGKDVVEAAPLDFTLTVPAVWSDSAKNLTLQAAEIAGFGKKNKIRLISEPEAAAVCCLKEIQTQNLDVGDTFVVADCGGGTVDVISYRILSLSPKLQVVECIEGNGRMCGSTVLNERFEDLVRKRIGDRYDKMKPSGRMHIVEHFECCLKPRFSDSEDDDLFTCPIPGVPDDPAAGIEDGFFVIERNEMKEIFDPVVRDVVQLVQQQVTDVEKLEVTTPRAPVGGDVGTLYGVSYNEEMFMRSAGLSTGSASRSRTRRVKAVVLVGGFGASDYLFKRLKADLKSKAGGNIEILQPTRAWSAVVRGAVMRGLEGGMVQIRKARRNYGHSISEGFISGIHPEKDLYIDHHDGSRRCRDRMKWYIYKGDEAEENDPIKYRFFINLSTLQERSWGVPLLASDIPIPPCKSTSSEIYTVCTLTVDLTQVPKEKFKKMTGTGNEPYYRLDFHLTMVIQSASLLFGFELDGKVYRNVHALYE